MVNDDENRGSIGKYYKELVNQNSMSSARKDDESSEDSKLDKQISIDDIEINEDQKSQHQKKFKINQKPMSCPRNNRRRSRKDRNTSNHKPKASKTGTISTGTTIIVIRKPEKDGGYETKDISDFSELEEEIIKIKNDAEKDSKTHYKSENRVRRKTAGPQVFGYHRPQKGKPPLQSPSSKDTGISYIPKLGDNKTPIKQKIMRKSTKVINKNIPQKQQRTSSNASEEQSNMKNTTQLKPNGEPQYKFKQIDDLIQKKKEALGIKPLNATLSSYQEVIKENQRLRKTVEEMKQTIKKLRQERVEKVKEIEKRKENEKKLELLIKHETPLKTRQHRSSFRNTSRGSSNASVNKKGTTMSPQNRYSAKYDTKNDKMNDSD